RRHTRWPRDWSSDVCSSDLLPRGALARRGRQVHSRAPGLAEPDRDGLLRRPRAVLALADVVDLFVDELARLRRRALALTLVASRSEERRVGKARAYARGGGR